MKNRMILRVVLAAVSGHAAGLLFLFPMAFICKKLDNPDAGAFPIAIIAIILGSAVCGLLSRKMSLAPLGGLLSGLVFGTLLLIVSLIGGDSEFGFFTKFVFCISSSLISFAVASIMPKKKSSRKNAAGRVKAMQKKIRY